MAASRAGRTSLCFEARRPSACASSFLCFLRAATPRLTRDIPSRSFLEVRQQLADELEVALGHEPLALVTTLAGRRLVLVQVAFECLRPRQAPAPGELETLLGAAVTLELGHGERTSLRDVNHDS